MCTHTASRFLRNRESEKNEKHILVIISHNPCWLRSCDVQIDSHELPGGVQRHGNSSHGKILNARFTAGEYTHNNSNRNSHVGGSVHRDPSSNPDTLCHQYRIAHV
jgi:hypothetical protein